MQQNSFGHLIGPQTPSAQSGDPIVAPAPPSEARAQAAEARAQAADARAADANARANAQNARQQASFDGSGGQGTESQNKAAVLLGRISGGFADIEDIIGTYPEAERPGLAETLSYGALGAESVIARRTTDWQRRAINDVQRDIVDALLTMGTGAAYNEEQLEAMRVSYFPQFGDSEEEIAYKRRRLVRMIETARIQAGPNAARLDEVMAPLTESLSQPATEVRQPTSQLDSAPLGYETGFDKWGRDDPFDRVRALQALGVDQTGEMRLVGLLNANRGNRGLTMEGLQRIYSDAGVPTPDEAGMQDLLAQLQEGRAPTTGIDTSALREQYERALDRKLDEGGDENTQGSAALFGTARGVTLSLNDEITGAGAAIGAAFSGENVGDAYRANRDLVRRQTDRTREEHPITSIGSEIGGALLTGGRTFPTPQNVGQAARIGAIEGGVYGFGSGDGLTNSLANAGLGAAGGAATGAALQPVVNSLGKVISARRAAKFRDNADELANASERTGVPLRRMDVETARQTRRAALLQNPKTRDIIRDADAEDLRATERAVERDLGGGTDDFAAGSRIQEGLTRTREQMRQRAGGLYDRAHSQSGDARVEPTAALKAIDDNIAELTEAGANQNASAIRYLQGVREDMAREGGLTIRALRDQRTGMRSSLSASGLDRTDLDRRMTQILDAAGQDIERGLSGTEALATFRQADDLWREQAQFREQILDRLIGRRGQNSPDQTARALQNFVRSDYRQARRVMDALDPADRVEVANLVAANLGRDQRRRFSLSRFLTQTSEGKGGLIDKKTQRLIFGEDGVRAIRDLRALSSAKEEAASATNHSNTGNIVQHTGRNLRNMILGLVGLSEVGVTGGIAAPVAGSVISRIGDERAARLLINPDFTRWLRRTPATSNPAAINSHFERLRSLAQRTPGMIADVDALERAIVGAVNDNAAGRLAAENQGEQE